MWEKTWHFGENGQWHCNENIGQEIGDLVTSLTMQGGLPVFCSQQVCVELVVWSLPSEGKRIASKDD